MYSNLFEPEPETRCLACIFFLHFNDFWEYFFLAQKLIA